MLSLVSRKVFGTANDRTIKKFQRTVEAINALEEEIAAKSDDELRARTTHFQQQIQAEDKNPDDFLVEAFAIVREAAKRTMGMRHYDVQLIGGLVLHHGMIAEMRTGEGKTLMSTLPAYLNALSGKGVHIVTVNDYLASRDAEWMGEIYNFLGLTVDCIKHGLTDSERQQAYNADITYATNNELGFDYLRDNMKFSLESMVQRAPAFAIVDEVDSILIDEARTPLIISGPAETADDLYIRMDKVVLKLDPDSFDIDEKSRSITLTEEGQEELEELLRQDGLIQTGGLYDIQNINLLHHAQQALKAQRLFNKDKDYVIHQGQLVIVDEFTGRMMEGRRFSEGLHQALEAKEGVDIQRENQTLASITFQNYFRLYEKLSGMTGTAQTEAAEFEEIYGLGVVTVPTNLPIQRLDDNDEIYRTVGEKNTAVLADIKDRHAAGQPILVGTASIKKSEELAALLTKEKITHKVLNARHHEKEADIIAQAGRPGAVTIATNMAGRGTDIQLGGNFELLAEEGVSKEQYEQDKQAVLEAGGLYVLATERHESRRIDNQLRGRSGRQGDPGRSKFYISLEDDFMRIFGMDRMQPILQRIKMPENEPITHSMLTKAVERAQKRIEARNFDIRKNLLKYDNVMNDQRTMIYDERRDMMQADDVRDVVDEFRHELIRDMVLQAVPPKSYPEQWDLDGLTNGCQRVLNVDLPIEGWASEEGIAEEELIDRITGASDQLMSTKRQQYGDELLRNLEKSIVLQILDQVWKEHLLSLDHLRQGINLRAYGQKDPLNEYKREAFAYFEGMLERLKETVTTVLSTMEVQEAPPEYMDGNIARDAAAMFDQATFEHDTFPHAIPHAGDGNPFDDDPMSPLPASITEGEGTTTTDPIQTRNIAEEDMDPNDPSTWGRVPRNAPCPCGSGKKYKQCHGLLV